jgi:WXG100 family type VII secretion target
MATYSVNMSNVQEVAAEMGAVAQFIQSMLEDLDNGSKQNLSEWTSSARDAYNQAKQIWDNAASDMVAQASKAQSSLSSINDNYANAEYQGLGLWGQ